MRHFNAKAERERKQRDNNRERIMQIANSKGRFAVSLRWRDTGLRKLCRKLVKSGQLRGGQIINGTLIYYPRARP